MLWPHSELGRAVFLKTFVRWGGYPKTLDIYWLWAEPTRISHAIKFCIWISKSVSSFSFIQCVPLSGIIPHLTLVAVLRWSMYWKNVLAYIKPDNCVPSTLVQSHYERFTMSTRVQGSCLVACARLDENKAVVQGSSMALEFDWLNFDSIHPDYNFAASQITAAWQNSESGLTGWRSNKAVLPEQREHLERARNAVQGPWKMRTHTPHVVSLSCLPACQGQVCRTAELCSRSEQPV